MDELNTKALSSQDIVGIILITLLLGNERGMIKLKNYITVLVSIRFDK